MAKKPKNKSIETDIIQNLKKSGFEYINTDENPDKYKAKSTYVLCLDCNNRAINIQRYNDQIICPKCVSKRVVLVDYIGHAIKVQYLDMRNKVDYDIIVRKVLDKIQKENTKDINKLLTEYKRKNDKMQKEYMKEVQAFIHNEVALWFNSEMKRTIRFALKKIINELEVCEDETKVSEIVEKHIKNYKKGLL